MIERPSNVSITPALVRRHFSPRKESFVLELTRSADLWRRAASVLAGGVDSPVRAGKPVGGPIIVREAAGAYVVDADGRRLLDYLMAYGPLLLGHAHPALTRGLDEAAARGTLYGCTHEDEVRLAERLRAHMPSLERIRFTNSGTESVMSAIRVARGFTGREAILRFAGNYHGHFDQALLDAGASAGAAGVGPSGIPQGVARDTIVCRYNDLDGLDAALCEHGPRLAAIVVEPVVGNMGLVHPLPGFLEGLRDRTQRCGALLIFDEVITAFRLGLGGAQGRCGVTPDLTTLGKVLGGGYPLAAFGGRADVMRVLAPEGTVFQGGTLSGNPFCVALAHRLLDVLEGDPELLPRMRALGERLAAGLREVLDELELRYPVVHDESIVDFMFRVADRPHRDYDEAREGDGAAYGVFYREMLSEGVLLAPSQNEVMFLSSAHTADDVDLTVRAARAALSRMRARGEV
ncbi:aminotransferase class III-fold pyridoxal phosphate-dependent enzyme [bacterium]|nr:MAG: aminotransferase class III-fold pyridoxal phosphate-dependent enzyme [bacterium]